MFRAQFKLLLLLLTLLVLFACLATAWWMYQNVIVRDAQISKDIAKAQSVGGPVHDPGARRFEAAIDLIKGSKLGDGRDALYKLLQMFPRSPTCPEAKRIIGEMNMDALYKLDASGGKRDYIVQPGDALLAIAARNHTTVEALARINSLTSVKLQPGEHLFVIPMVFEIAVDVSERRVTLLRDGYFFKEYSAIDIKLPPGLKVPVELEVSSKSAMFDNKIADPVTPDYVKAEKRLIAHKSNSSSGVGLLVRTPPAAQAVDGGSNDANVSTGLFLSSEDLEEIFPLLRKGSKFSLVQ